MKREQVISEAKYPGSKERFRDLPVALSTALVDIFDSRVFRKGIRVDGDPLPFICYTRNTSHIIRAASPEEALAQYEYTPN